MNVIITLKSSRELEKMRVSGKLSADLHTYLSQHVKPGITTLELDKMAESFIRERGGVPAFKGYRGFPFTLCTSTNDEVVHCKPSNKPLKNGDIITIDLGAVVDGYHSDTAKTYIVGDTSMENKLFILDGYSALWKGIDQVRPGNYVSDISNAVGKVLTEAGYGVVQEFVGHGIGLNLHEEPQIQNNQTEVKGPELTEGMVICIEPIVTQRPETKITKIDDWDTKTSDGSLACHWEHTIAITKDGPEVLTLRDEERR